LSDQPNSPSNDEEAKSRLNNLGREAVRVLRDSRPKLHRELKEAGRVHLWAWEKQRAAARAIGELVSRGVPGEEAYEQVASQYLDLPEEQ